MLVQTYYPHRLSPARYDTFLASGWFRGSVMLYKMDVLCIDEDIFSVVNIRMNLDRHVDKKWQRKLKKKVEDRFNIVFRDAFPTEEKERLYTIQKKKFQGFIHPTLQDYLNSSLPSSVFNTKEVCVYDGNELIAVSFFDFGKKSMASLLCLYNEDYKQFSLGIYTMLKEVDIGKSEGKKWYYPGYVLDEDSGFNYKLRLGSFEYYNHHKRWSAFEKFDTDQCLSKVFKSKIKEVTEILDLLGVLYKHRLYPFFSMGYVGFWSVEFLKHPVFIEINRISEDEHLIISYDIEHQTFVISKVIYASHYNRLINMEVSEDFRDQNKYFLKLLLVSEQCAVESSAVSAIGWLAQKKYI
jgi:arginine-tRNA-protein transferase